MEFQDDALLPENDSQTPPQSSSATSSAHGVTLEDASNEFRRLVESIQRVDLSRPSPAATIPSEDGFSFSFDEEHLVPSKTTWRGTSNGPQKDFHASYHQDDLVDSQRYVYTKSPDYHPDSKITVSRTLLVSEQSQTPPVEDSPDSAIAPTATPSKSRAALSRTLTGLSRKPKLTRDGSQSPDKQFSKTLQDEPPKSFERSRSGRRSLPAQGRQKDSKTREEKESTNALLRSRSMLKRQKDSFGSILRFPPSDLPEELPTPKRPGTPQRAPPATPRDRSPVPLSHGIPKVPALPATLPTEKLSNANTDSNKKKDDLWGAFRTLENEYQKFRSKSIPNKMIALRSSLLSFLRTNADHPLNRNLRPEDLDRRATILNKWWVGLLEALNVHSMSGTDRGAVLDGISGIMDRPEWRSSLLTSSPSSKSKNVSQSQEAEPKTSMESDHDDFVLESVHHNIRNMFVQNLFTQIVFVVDRMSLRTAPANLVTFCGKACAFAFWFCPGIADILVRLWNVQTNNLRRVARAHGIGRAPRLHRASEKVVRAFPTCLHSLACSSIKDLAGILQKKPVLPLGVEKVQWHGHWLGRWSGKDSDLFYNFVKHFYILLPDYLPAEASEEEKLSAPGVMIIHAQLLANIDATIHRQAAQEEKDAFNERPLTFDDVLTSDGSASMVRDPHPTNAHRPMAENRAIILLRDTISERSSTDSCNIFAQSFCAILTACAESTSMYDQPACITLCDLLQEALVILVPYQSVISSEIHLLDWDFWLTVFRRMVESQNTMTEMRVYALLFTIWKTITEDESRKASLCMDFLLEESRFIYTFNHWCPMVRAYYMRLLCWRIARYDGEATDSEIEFLETLHKRLGHVWAHYKCLSVRAEDEDTLAPSTAPCNPVPGRRLLIIRTDNPVTTTLVSFNNMSPSSSSGSPHEKEKPLDYAQAASNLFERVTASFTFDPTEKKKPGNLFRSFLANRSPSRSPGPENKTSEQEDNTDSALVDAEAEPSTPDITSRSSLYESRPSLSPPEINKRSKIPNSARSSSAPHTPRSTLQRQAAFFKFSLESTDRRPNSIRGDAVLFPPRLPMAAQLLLQAQPSFVADADPACMSSHAAIQAGKYAGRALAEWALVVNECQNFFERRRNEGVPSNADVETPVLSIEGFKRM